MKTKKFNSRADFENSKGMLLKSTRSQSEVITTVLLVLIGIVAVGLLSAFVINFVRNNLQSSDCLGLQGQVTINTDDALTYFNLTSNVSYIVIERTQKNFNLSGVNVILENDGGAKSYKIRAGTSTNICVVIEGTNCNLSANANVSLPETSNPKVTYKIDSSGDFKASNPVKKISIVPLLKGEVACTEAMDEKIMSIYP
jgi:flagellin-like protein